MTTAILMRYIGGDHGTLGRLVETESGLDVLMMELPNRNNEVQMSRIPEGSYLCQAYKSPKFGRCWLLRHVPGRTSILIHKGNLAGDTRKGWKTHSLGCLLPAWYKGWIGRQMAGLNSTRAFTEMMSKLGHVNFTLKIIDLC